MTAKLLVSSLCGVAAVALACASPVNPSLERAQEEYAAATADPEVTRYAPRELQEAEVALERAQRAHRRGDDDVEVDHLAYLASRRVEIAQVSGDRKHTQATPRDIDVDVHLHPDD